ncbi:MAG: MurR/RpiR family transcriptional regulator [Gammaproteobacteria bacterium]
MQTKLLRLIEKNFDNLRKSEKKVASFAIENSKWLSKLKMAEAAEAIGVSEPSINRFCKALGFSGYSDFKNTLARQLAAEDYFETYEINDEDSIFDLTEKVFETTISEILNIQSQLSQDMLEEAIEALANANRVEFYAFGGSVPVAMDAQHKFFRLKIASSCISDPHIQFMSANSLNKNDVVVVISHSGTTAALVESIKTVKKTGVTVIGIMPKGSPVAKLCDIPLEVNVGGDSARITKPLTSRLGYMAIIDVLTLGVAQLKPEAQDHLYNILVSQESLKIKN